MINSRYCPQRLIPLALTLSLYIFCIILCYLFSPVVLYAEDSPTQVNLGPYDTIVLNDPFDPKRGKNNDLSENKTSAAEKDLKSHYQVYGTMIVGETRLAYLKVTNPKARPFVRVAQDKGKDIRTVRPGDLVEGWTVEDITPRGVVFRSRRGESVQIGIFDTTKEGQRTNAPVAFQAPQPRSHIRPIPISRSTKRASTGTGPIKSGTGSVHRPNNKKALQLQKIFGHHNVPTNSGIQAGKRVGTSNRPFFTPPASPGNQGRPNPFLELLKRAREGRQ